MLLRRFSRPLTWALPLALCAGLLLQPDAAAQAAKNGLLLCGNLVVPALFPFFILSSLLVSTGGAARLGRLLSGVMGRLFHQTGASASALVLGFLGGYPVGAKTVCTLYEEKLCDRAQAEHLLMFCNNAGPAFILGAAGSAIFHSTAVGFLLLTIQISSALLVGFLFRPVRREIDLTQAPTDAPRPFSRCLTESVQQAASATVNVCAFVIFFNVVLRLLDCCGLFGLCRGLLALCHCPDAWQLAIALRRAGAVQRGGAAAGHVGRPHPCCLPAQLGRVLRPLPDPDLSHPARPEPAPLLSRKAPPGLYLRRPGLSGAAISAPGATDAESHPTAPGTAAGWHLRRAVDGGLRAGTGGVGAGWVAFGKKHWKTTEKTSIINGIMDRN